MIHVTMPNGRSALLGKFAFCFWLVFHAPANVRLIIRRPMVDV